MPKKIKLLIPHNSQRGNFYPRGIYLESELPPEILRSKNINILFEEENSIDVPSVEFKENIVEVKKTTRKQKEDKGLVESKIVERKESIGIEKIDEKSPVIEKINHNFKQPLPEPTRTELEPILDKELDKEVTVKENKVQQKITRLI